MSARDPFQKLQPPTYLYEWPLSLVCGSVTEIKLLARIASARFDQETANLFGRDEHV
jgi:hypothetical protein